MAPTASKRFERAYQAVADQEARIGRALSARSKEFFAKANVVGFGAGHKNGRLAALFFVRKKVSRSQLAPKDRVPACVRVGFRWYKTAVVAIGEPRVSVAIGDPSANRRSYHVEGVGTWQMGTMIRVFAGATTRPEGTCGALVQGAGASAPLMLSCAHVLLGAGNDVAQFERNRELHKLRNHVGQVHTVLPLPTADAGIVECSGATKEILHIGAPRSRQPAVVDLYVQKSGATTGLTFTTILATNASFQMPVGAGGAPVAFPGCFAVRNECTQAPPAPGAVPAGTPANRFSWTGDSGALIVVGKPDAPGVFGDRRLQARYDAANDAEKRRIRDQFERAALGLLVGKSDGQLGPPGGAAGPGVPVEVCFGQDIQLALTGLAVTLVT